jgi:hypothetical protein
MIQIYHPRCESQENTFVEKNIEYEIIPYLTENRTFDDLEVDKKTNYEPIS